MLKGDGIGVGVGLQIATPFVTLSDSPKNLPGTKTQLPGVGTRVRYSAFAPDPMEPGDFANLCAVFSGDGILDGLQTSYSTFIFCAPASIASVTPLSLWGLGFSIGIGAITALGGLGADAVPFQMELE